MRQERACRLEVQYLGSYEIRCGYDESQRKRLQIKISQIIVYKEVPGSLCWTAMTLKAYFEVNMSKVMFFMDWKKKGRWRYIMAGPGC